MYANKNTHLDYLKILFFIKITNMLSLDGNVNYFFFSNKKNAKTRLEVNCPNIHERRQFDKTYI